MVVLFMGSIQLISLGVIGEYIRLIFLETKGRPTYLVKEQATETAEQGVSEALPKRRAS